MGVPANWERLSCWLWATAYAQRTSWSRLKVMSLQTRQARPGSMTVMRLTALVSGTVQGVGYRNWVQRHARDLTLSGYAENLSDGRVEVIAEGTEANLKRLLHWLKQGPPHARVQGIETQYSESTGLSDFHVY